MFKVVASEFPEQWPIQFSLNHPSASYQRMVEVRDWCMENFGQPDLGVWTYGGLSIWFKDSSHATLFRVKWG